MSWLSGGRWVRSGPFDSLRLLSGVAQTGKIRTSARELGYSAAQVSRMLDKLGRRAGGRLLVTGPRGSVMTKRGLGAVSVAHAILCLVDSAEDPSIPRAPGAAACFAGEVLPCEGTKFCAGRRLDERGARS